MVTNIVLRLWLYASLILSVGMAGYSFLEEPLSIIAVFPLSFVFSVIISLPALAILYFSIIRINKLNLAVEAKLAVLAILIFFIALPYGTLAGLINIAFDFFEDHSVWKFLQTTATCTAILFACASVAIAINFRKIKFYFSENEAEQNFIKPTKITTNMETIHSFESQNDSMNRTSKSNKILVKALITGLLIIFLLIPTFFISSLVTERQERNQKVVTEASNSWATSQTLTGPYLFIPYKYTNQYIVALPENIVLNGEVIPENRKRSIYKILLYKSSLKGNGIFQLPKNIDTSLLQFSNARICLGLSDFKGIEEKISITFNSVAYELSPGLPISTINNTGLSAPIQILEGDILKNIPFDFSIKIKGSGALHFMPLAGNSVYTLSSVWPSPSFDGNNLPTENNVSDKGFSAKWVFNKANLPFTTILEDGKEIKEDLAFGVSILQPVDDYAKTDRCIKYAILFIGLTFSLFFIVEIMQKKPVHPVQYILVGFALVIFYTLLLSISEYIHFDYAYLIASIATVLLISLYAKSHFIQWKIAGLFFTVLATLYGFNYVLISLEDSALLIGSTGLFIVLATAMYASRKINWYNSSLAGSSTEMA